MTSTKFANDVLQTHNKYRAKHRAPDLKISAKLSEFAQEWADDLASKDAAEHRPNNAYGENLYMAGSTDPNWKLEGETVVKSWYDEINLYKFGEPSPMNASEVGHFTQLVWKGTAELGIGEAKSKVGKVYVVCNYDPPGNVLGEFKENVIALDNTGQKENGNGPSIGQGEEVERAKIVLTASQEKIGIRIVQPNIKIVESMNRLYAVPSEKIRVWSVWLTKIEEEANEWHSWLRSHINLVLRMSEFLRKAEEEVKRENELKENRMVIEGQESPMGLRLIRVDSLYRKERDKPMDETSRAADAGEGSDGLTVRFEERDSEIVDANKTQLNAAGSAMETEEMVGNEGISSGEVGDEPSEAEAMERLPSGSELSLNVENNGDANDGNRDRTRKSSDGAVETDGTTMEPEKIAWPIGVPWQPVNSTTLEKNEVAKKKDGDVKVIPIPGNVEDMLRLVNDVKRQATIYESFYKHWQEVADRAVKEMMNRTVVPSDSVLSDEQIPYFFYVYVEPDIDIGVENDDETVFPPDPAREKITCEFTSLYFNLADKPGRGGKAWL